MISVTKAWADCPPIFADRLLALLAAPGRIFHGLHHVNQLLLDADRLCDPHWLRPLRWAILYHDAIFEPLADEGVNEQASAELWLEHFSAIYETTRGVSGQWEQDVATAILATTDPFSRPATLLPWQHALLDLALSALSRTPRVYEAERLLRMEEFLSAGGTPAQWSATRQTFVRRALDSHLLFHRVCRDREAAARDNLRQELSGLQDRRF